MHSTVPNSISPCELSIDPQRINRMLKFISQILGRRRPELPQKKSNTLLRLQVEVARQTVEQELRTKRPLRLRLR